MIIESLKIINFKKFKGEHNISFNDKYNVLIGDNESGKSTILLAIDLLLSGSRNRIDSIGLENLFNIEVIKEFKELNDKSFDKLPEIYIESKIKDSDNFELEGRRNKAQELGYGIKLEISPDDEYISIISEILNESYFSFPFEYYKISFTTFADNPYTPYNRPLKYIKVNESNISNDYIAKEFTKDIYDLIVSDKVKNSLRYKYRQAKEKFDNENLKFINDEMASLQIGLSKDNRNNLDNNIAIYKDEIQLVDRGSGTQTKLKIESVIENKGGNLDVVLIEEPENHLSANKTKELLQTIMEDNVIAQLFVTTHNSMICSRMGLNNIIALSTNEIKTKEFSKIDSETVNFFEKNTTNNVLELILTNKAILVEGAAEYILLEKFYETICGHKPETDNISIISVSGLSFKRYLDISKELGIKTVVITDNDGDYNANVVEKYSDYQNDEIKVYSDSDNERYTFEVCLYKDNEKWLYENKITKSKDLLEFMLNNKAENAFRILKKLEEDNNIAKEFTIPKYIEDALKWIKD